MARVLVAAAILALYAACSSGDSVSVEETPEPATTPSPTPAPVPTPPESPTPAPAATETLVPAPDPGPTESSTEDVIRALAVAFYDAYNAFDADAALALTAEGYREKAEETIRTQVLNMEAFGVLLTVTEESPPTMTAPGEWETVVVLTLPAQPRRIRIVFRQIEGDWKIVNTERLE